MRIKNLGLILILMMISTIALAAKHTLIFTSVSVPGDSHTEAMKVFKRELEKLTNGEIEVKVHHSGSLFTQDAAPAAVMRGKGANMYYGSFQRLAKQMPYLAMFGAGYAFKSYHHMNQVLSGEIGKKVFEDIAKKTGLRPLAAMYLGTRQINLRDIGREVKTPADMKGVKMRMPNSPAWLALGKALGSNPTPLAFSEVYLALKTGTVDGQDNPLPTDKNAKFYEVTKYIVLTDHVIGVILPAINEKVWQSLGADLQAKVMQAIGKAKDFNDNRNLNTEEDILDFFKEKGMTIIKPDKDAFIKNVKMMYQNNPEFTKGWDFELKKKIDGIM